MSKKILALFFGLMYTLFCCDNTASKRIRAASSFGRAPDS